METDNRTIACPHVLEGKMPEMVMVEDAILAVASCFECADQAEATGNPDTFKAVCPHTLPQHDLWKLDQNFPGDGIYQLLDDGAYHRQPDLPEPGNA